MTDSITSVSAPAADHLLAPSAGGWTLWRDSVLRTAGFPIADVDRLADPEAAALADGLGAALESRAVAAAAARAEIAARTTAELRAGEAADRTTLRELRAASRRLDAPGAAAQEAAARWLAPRTLERLVEADDALRQAGDAYAAGYADALRRLAAATARQAADPLFRAAVAWQNHGAIAMALDPLVEDAPMSGSRRRQREALVANYLQRYATKNDTIGFFGAMCWTRIGGPGEAGLYRHGPALVRSRAVHFEDWPVTALAESLRADPRVLPSLVPSMQPFLRLEGTMLLVPGGAACELDAGRLALLSLCDGQRDVAEIATIALANPYLPFVDHHDVETLLRQLEGAGWLALAWRVPSCAPDPERALRAHLQALAPGMRDDALERLDRLEAARADVAESSADATALTLALGRTDEVFRELTGAESRRRPGQVYGGRALLYEDCHRDLDVVLPEAALAPLRDPLDLVLASGRWFTSEAGKAFERAFDGLFDEVRAADGDSARDIAFPDFWTKAQSVLFGDRVPIAEVSRELRARWQRVLSPFVADGARRVHVRAEQVREACTELFATDDAGWNLARYLCPDLMFEAADAQAMLRGDYTAVLGEVHVGGNTLATNMFASGHPQPERILQALRRDLGPGYVVPKLSPEASDTPIRTQMLDDPQACVEIVFSRGFVPANASTALPIGALRIERAGGQLRVRHDASGWTAPLLDVLGDFLFLVVVNKFGLLDKRAHQPRITLGQLVIQRESWTLGGADLDVLREPDEAACFRRVRGWASERGMPRRLFAKMPWEPKPVFVDLASVAYVRNLAKLVRNAPASADGALVTFTEMSPGPDGAWLADAAGRAYACELRLVALHRDDLPR